MPSRKTRRTRSTDTDAVSPYPLTRNVKPMMTETEQKALISIALMAALADGNNSDAERAEVKRIADSLSQNGVADISAMVIKAFCSVSVIVGFTFRVSGYGLTASVSVLRILRGGKQPSGNVTKQQDCHIDRQSGPSALCRSVEISQFQMYE